MTVEKLKQYGYLKKEIKDLEDKIKDIHGYSGINYERTGATGGGISNPVVAAVEKAEKLESILKERLEKAQDLLIEIEDWLDSVDDSYIRQAIDYHYIKGYSWQATSYKLTKNTVDGVIISNMITRYLKKSEEK